MIYQKIKHYMACFLAIIMIVSCISACFITQVHAEGGAWETGKPETAATLPAEVKTAFDQATADYQGASFIPMAYYATQVVNGTNYAVLCYKTLTTNPPTSSLAVVKIYKDLSNKASVIGVEDFDIGKYAKGNNVDLSKKPADGAWAVPSDYTKAASTPKEALEAFTKATTDYTGNNLEIMAYLGSQVVNGTNYAYLCHSTLVTKDPVESIQVVIVYAGLDRKASVSSIYTLIPDTFVVEKAANTAKAAKTSVKKTFTVKALKKKAKTVTLPKVTTTHGTAKWKVTAKDKKKVLSLSGKKIKVKKGAKKGTYTIKVKAVVAETSEYKAASTKVVTVKIKVKK